MSEAAVVWSQMTPEFWESVFLTLRLAFVSTLLLMVLGLPIAHWLNRSRWRGIIFIETLVTMPIVLPPTVIGFYLLVIFAPQHAPGALWKAVTGHTLAFSFSGLVVGSIIYSLPFALQPFQAALRSVPDLYVEAAKVEGASTWQIFRNVNLPLAWRGIMVGIVLSFAHTVGEFGIVLMLGGSIPGQTKVASIALYDEMQKLNYSLAEAYALTLLAISFTLIFFISLLKRKD
ncbi:MAG: molybdate ABC transporter permease subunit [Chthoniobacteraceae bacterium]